MSAAEEYRRALDATCGDLTVFPLTGYDRTGVPVVAAVWDPAGGGGDVHGVGYGTSVDAATVGALGETAERALLAPALRRARTHRASYGEMKRHHGETGVADPAQLTLPAGTGVDDHRPYVWTATTRWRTGETVWVPVEFVAFDGGSLPAAAGLTPVITPISNGLGAGDTLARAVGHALLELVQRDGDTVSFRAMDAGVVVDVDSLADRGVRDLLARYRAVGVDPVVKLAATEFATVVYCTGTDRDPEGSGRAPRDDVRVLTGDREGSLEVLRRGSYDAVVDTYTDEHPGAPAVRRTAQLLSGRVGHYCYVSGMSVYAPGGPAVPDEHAPVRQRGREPDDDPLQARSLAKLDGEHAVREAFDGPSLFPRVGIMVGPRDPSGRFTWWPERLRRALRERERSSVLGPGSPARPVQYSDARDIARWLIAMAEAGGKGVFNAVGPLRDESLATVLDSCLHAARQSLGSSPHDIPDEHVQMSWCPDETALRHEVRRVPEEGRPLWYPEDQIPQQSIDSRAAARAGLLFRDTEVTAADTLSWSLQQRTRPLPRFREPLSDRWRRNRTA